MFSMKKDRLLYRQMENWIKEGENDKAKFIIDHTVPTDFSSENDESLLHLTAMYGNLHIMEYLINIGIEVDVRDAFNTTTLMHAIIHKKWAAAAFLLKYNADIFARDTGGATPLSELMKIEEPNLEVLLLFFDRVRSQSTDKKDFAANLRKFGCTLNNIIHLHDAEATTIFLSLVDTVDRGIIFCSIEIAMRLMDQENMKLLLHHGETEGKKEDFVICLRNMLVESRFDESFVDIVRVATQQLIEWKLLNNITVRFIELIFHEAPEVCLRRVLSDSLVSYIKNDFNYDIRVHMFGNKNNCVLKMVQNGEAEMNALSRKGRTALHVATKCGAIDTMKYLLDCGVNPNVRDENGKPPIFKAFNHEECFRLLLLYGADLQATDDSGRTYLNYFTSPRNNYELLKIVAAHLAILQSSGVTVREPFRSYIFASEGLPKYFLLRCQQLEKTKTLNVHGSLTFFETLVESVENLTRRVSSLDHETIEKFFSSSTVQEHDSYYISTSKERLEKAVTINNLRSIAAAVICDSIEVLKPYYIVIDKICSFLSYYDLRVFE